MKINRIRNKDKTYPMPHEFNIAKDTIVLETIDNKNWYLKYLTSQAIPQDIHQEAGIKENIIGGILGAIILIMTGFNIEDASKRTSIPVADIEQALSDPLQLEQAQSVIDSIDTNVDKPSTYSTPFLDEAFEYIGKHEGIKLNIYDDTKGHPTIGIGHKILPFENFSSGISITEAKQLFEKDIQERLSVTKRIFPHFDTYPNSIKVALLDGVYRGDHKSSYRTTKLINEGKWTEAAQEYINHNDYVRSKNKGTGVMVRMDDNAKRLYEYGIQLANLVPSNGFKV